MFHTLLSSAAGSIYLVMMQGYRVLLFVWIILQSCTENRGTWTMYKADAASSSYSPLDQVNNSNVHQLEQAWVFHPNDLVGGRMGGSQCNPIVIDEVMYVA